MKPWTLIVVTGFAMSLQGCGPATVDGVPDGHEPAGLDASPEVDSATDALKDVADISTLEDAEQGGCGANGALLGNQSWGTYAKSTLEALLEEGVSIENGYSVWTVRYCTSGREAQATLTIPDGPPPGPGWHVAVNNPGTVGVADGCALSQSVGGAGLAGYFGARGLLGVSVDYPGLGTPGPHPYLVREVEGRASLDAVRAVQHWAAEHDVPLSGRAVVAGLSQGGHATLAAAMVHGNYAPELEIRAWAAAAPASGFLEHWAPSIAFAGDHVIFHALLVYAWSVHYGHTEPPVWAPGIEGDIESIMEGYCTFDAQGFDLASQIGTDPHGIFHPDFLAAFAQGNFENYPVFEKAWADNRIGPYEGAAPLRIYQGEADTVVLPSATSEVVATLKAGGVDVELISVPDGTHTNVAFFFLANAQSHTDDAVHWFKTQLNAATDPP